MSSTDIAVTSIANLAATRGCKGISADKSHVVSKTPMLREILSVEA